MGVLAVLLASAPARAADPGCPDAELFSGKLITDICWDCLLPVRIAGVGIGGGSHSVPAGAATSRLCACTSGTSIGVGFTLGFWEPARLVEVTQAPGCAPALGGVRLPAGNRRLIGTEGRAAWDGTDGAFWHYHWYAFPLTILLDLFWDNKCNPDGLVDFDVLYLSELDPTWNNDELAFFTNPEAAWLGHPVAQAACLGDATAATAGTPLDDLFWCAGTWGSLYPFAGRQPNIGSQPRETSLTLARALAALHRRGMARRTMGDDALCEAPIDPFMKKSGYKVTMFYPLPEAKKAHVIGQSTFTWGEWRSIPGPGEHHLYLLWRWHDCCVTYDF